MTKAEQYRRWLARKIWGPDGSGWAARGHRSKRDNAIIDKWIKKGDVEVDDAGLIRLTNFGRVGLDLRPIF
jgi:hypothetical protein